MKNIVLFTLILAFQPGIFSQVLGGPCEGCEATMEHPLKISQVDTIPGFEDANEPLVLRGVVRHLDGNPAKDIILYIHQTNSEGIYPPEEGSGWSRRHGQHRGWVKTGADGRYTFYTFKPGAYPGRKDPRHIHLYIKEPGKIPYYVDDFLFADDPRLTADVRQSQRNRGGNGILAPESKDGVLYAERIIILGKNIPNYE